MTTQKTKQTKAKVSQPVKAVASKTRKAPTKKKKVSASRATCDSCTCTCRPEECFWVNNGPVIATMSGLLEAVRTMSDEQFDYHTARDGNDFARWVRFSLSDSATAGKLEKANSRTQAIKALESTCACK